jgi:hypothetical protein
MQVRRQNEYFKLKHLVIYAYQISLHYRDT